MGSGRLRYPEVNAVSSDPSGKRTVEVEVGLFAPDHFARMYR